jgi:8-oxo-dGTP pyrophosphatase MutT (NUDIX family)
VINVSHMVAETAYLRAVVAAHVPLSSREVASKARFLAEFDRLDDPCSEHADPVHVTASAIVVGARGTVLHIHKRLGRWMQPGGHIDPGEKPPVAARREAIEELGLDVAHPDGGPRLIHLDVHEAALGHTHLDLRYLLLGSSDDPHPPPGESPEARWYDWDAAAAMADEALAPALEVARAEWDALNDGGVASGGMGNGTIGNGVRADERPA